MTSMSLLVAIVVAFSLGFTVVAGGCPGARRNMTMEAACREACGAAPAPATARAMYQLCMDTLSDDDLSVDVAGEYAYRAAWRALWAYLDTMGRAWHLLGNAALAAGEEKAVLRRRQVPGGRGGHGQGPEQVAGSLRPRHRRRVKEGAGGRGGVQGPCGQLCVC
jgi:hypothetical protein